MLMILLMLVQLLILLLLRILTGAWGSSIEQQSRGLLSLLLQPRIDIGRHLPGHGGGGGRPGVLDR